MGKLPKTWRSSFGGKLGMEINALADYIRQGTLIGTPNVRISYTENGTVVDPQVSTNTGAGTTVQEQTTTAQWAKVVEVTLEDINGDNCLMLPYDGAAQQLEPSNYVTPPASFNFSTYDYAKELCVLTQPCDMEGNAIAGREAERNWVVKPNWQVADYLNIDWLDAQGQTNLDWNGINSNISLGHFYPVMSAYWAGGYLVPDYQQVRAITQHLGANCDNPYYDGSWLCDGSYGYELQDGLWKLNREYKPNDIILTDVYDPEHTFEVPLFNFKPVEGTTNWSKAVQYYGATKYYDRNLIGRFWVIHTHPSIA